MASATKQGDDSDLDDLIQQGGGANHDTSAGALEMETLVGGGGGGRSNGGFTPPPIPFGHVGAICALCCYSMQSRPSLSGCVLMSMLVFFIVATFISAKHEIDPLKVAKISRDYSTVQSQYDLSLGKIDHWCIFVSQLGERLCWCESIYFSEELQEAKMPREWLQFIIL
jgi:hypothetical protein